MASQVNPNVEADDHEKWVMHYSSNHHILLVGEGDFSFSASLAHSLGSALNIVASSLDPYDVLIKKYRNAKSNLESLHKLGASTFHSVDATKMKHDHPDLKMRKFDRIIFNFPHAGFHGKEDNASLIEMHRELVGGFFRNAKDMLRAEGEIHVNHKISAPFCCWNIEELAWKNSLALLETVDFNIKDYPGYENKRGDGGRCDKSFPLGRCGTFKFRFSSACKKMTKVMSHTCSTLKISQQPQNIPVQKQSYHASFNPGYPQSSFTIDMNMDALIQPHRPPIAMNIGRKSANFMEGYPNYPSEMFDRVVNGLRSNSSYEWRCGALGNSKLLQHNARRESANFMDGYSSYPSEEYPRVVNDLCSNASLKRRYEAVGESLLLQSYVRRERCNFLDGHSKYPIAEHAQAVNDLYSNASDEWMYKALGKRQRLQCNVLNNMRNSLSSHPHCHQRSMTMNMNNLPGGRLPLLSTTSQRDSGNVFDGYFKHASQNYSRYINVESYTVTQSKLLHTGSHGAREAGRCYQPHDDPIQNATPQISSANLSRTSSNKFDNYATYTREVVEWSSTRGSGNYGFCDQL